MLRILLPTYYQLKLLCLKLKEALKLISCLLAVVMIFSFVGYSSRLVLPKLLICNEDNSPQGGVLIGSITSSDIKTAVSLSDVSFEEGMELLERNNAEAMLHIEAGTVAALYEGNPAYVRLYINKNDGFARFLTSYMRELTAIINTTQNTGLIYMDSLYEHGFSSEERLKLFNEMQIDYVRAALHREKIFEAYDGSTPFNSFDIKLYYFSFVICCMLVLDYLLNKSSPLLNQAISERLVLSRYSRLEIILANALGIAAANVFLGIILDNLSIFIGAGYGLGAFLHNAAGIIGLSIFASSLSFFINLLIKNGRIAVIVRAIIFAALIILSGIILPSYRLGDVWIRINSYNPITYIHYFLVSGRVV